MCILYCINVIKLHFFVRKANFVVIYIETQVLKYIEHNTVLKNFDLFS